MGAVNHAQCMLGRPSHPEYLSYLTIILCLDSTTKYEFVVYFDQLLVETLVNPKLWFV